MARPSQRSEQIDWLHVLFWARYRIFFSRHRARATAAVYFFPTPQHNTEQNLEVLSLPHDTTSFDLPSTPLALPSNFLLVLPYLFHSLLPISNHDATHAITLVFHSCRLKQDSQTIEASNNWKQCKLNLSYIGLVVFPCLHQDRPCLGPFPSSLLGPLSLTLCATHRNCFETNIANPSSVVLSLAASLYNSTNTLPKLLLNTSISKHGHWLGVCQRRHACYTRGTRAAGKSHFS